MTITLHRISRLALAALALQGAAAGLWAEARSTSQTTKTIYLRLDTNGLDRAVVELTLHETGRTPKAPSMAIVLDQAEGERKTVLNQELGLEPKLRQWRLANGTEPSEVDGITLPPHSFVRFAGLSDTMDIDEVNCLIQ
jgi:hypothetical protein